MGKSSSNIKLTDSNIVQRHDLSSSKTKDELRDSSTSKSQKNKRVEKIKEDMRSSKSKLTNPEIEGEMRESHTVSIIK
jgi:carboxypeptidase C (cathepsin A)